MSEQEILEGNKLIAEFMGIYNSQLLLNINENIGSQYIPYLGDDYISNLKFHSSWDWLMPVVEKIENDLQDSFNVDIINKNQCEIVRNGNEFICGYGFETINHSKIEAVYNSIVEFIKWYNGSVSKTLPTQNLKRGQN